MSDRPHRRDFVRALAFGGAAGLATPPPVRADDPPKPEGEAPTEADARYALVIARFGRHLDDDAKKAVRTEIEAVVKRGEALRKLSLDNGDGPFPVFVPFRAPAE